MDRELTITERAVMIGILLADGENLLTREVADLLSLSHQGAYLLMVRASRSVPIYQDGLGRWKLHRTETSHINKTRE